MNILNSNVRGEVLNSTYPALLVVFFSILEGNTKEKTWKEQHDKTLQITQENHDRLTDKITPLVNVRAISLKDQERFTSPWAQNWVDEQKFEKIVSQLGRLLRDDKNLQALYHMLVMMTPSPSSTERTRVSLINVWIPFFYNSYLCNRKILFCSTSRRTCSCWFIVISVSSQKKQDPTWNHLRNWTLASWISARSVSFFSSNGSLTNSLMFRTCLSRVPVK